MAERETASGKEEGAYLTIRELSDKIGVATHVLRFWETRFPQLRPLKRSGNRRYYRPADVELAKMLGHLLNVEGYTVKGVQKLLGEHSLKKILEKQTDTLELVSPPAEDLRSRLVRIREGLLQALS